MERTVRTGDRQDYASAVGALWQPLGRTLMRLEHIAEAPLDQLSDDLLDELPGLQYSLHAAAEMAVGIPAPSPTATAHSELLAALSQARDATAEMVLALRAREDDLVERLLPEWRGALFRVRLARLRALERFAPAGPSEQRLPLVDSEVEDAPSGPSLVAVAASILVLVGALLFTAGAVLAAWPLWAAGLGLFAGGFLFARP
jgi:hypothetical protein